MNDLSGDKFLPPKLGEYKDELLAILVKARGKSGFGQERNKEAEQVWRDRVWNNIETTAKAFLAREAEKPSKSDLEDAQDRLDSIASALQWTKKLIDKALLPMTKLEGDEFGPSYADLLRAWHQGELDMAFDNNREAPRLGETEVRFRKALQAVAVLEKAATLAAIRSRKKHGGQMKHMDHVIVGLSSIFRDATGKEPGRGRGPFERFVTAFFRATEAKQRRDIVGLIKSSLPKTPGR